MPAEGQSPQPVAPMADVLAPGVIHRAIPLPDGNGIDVIDVDLDNADAHWTIQTRGVIKENGRIVGQAFTPLEWVTRLHGLAAVNGGYFGQDDGLGRKELVGLLVQNNRVRHAAPPLLGQGSETVRRGRYVRSAFGLTAAGQPSILWAATSPGHAQMLQAYSAPRSQPGQPWRVASAVGCGPMLIFRGRAVVTDYQERLVSPGPLPRTFVAYDTRGGQPRHLLIGMASGADFHGLAAWIADYFPRYDASQAEAAMCLDGGASTQMTYRSSQTLQSPRETSVTVPDALVLLPGR